MTTQAQFDAAMKAAWNAYRARLAAIDRGLPPPAPVAPPDPREVALAEALAAFEAAKVAARKAYDATRRPPAP